METSIERQSPENILLVASLANEMQTEITYLLTIHLINYTSILEKSRFCSIYKLNSINEDIRRREDDRNFIAIELYKNACSQINK